MKFYDIMIKEAQEAINHLDALINIYSKKLERFEKLPDSQKSVNFLKNTINTLKFNKQEEYNMLLYAKGIKENREEEFYRNIYEKGILIKSGLDIDNDSLNKN